MRPPLTLRALGLPPCTAVYRYVGGFTGRAFAFLENATGLRPELNLQADCAAVDAQFGPDGSRQQPTVADGGSQRFRD